MMRTLGFSCALSVVALAAPLGCGEPFTSSSGGTGGATTTTQTTMSTTTSGGGEGGVGGAGGGTTSSSSAGGGGQGGAPPCEPGGCDPGMYCDADTGACASCMDVTDSGFRFDTPALIDLGSTGTKIFPRVRSEPGGGHRMVFSVDTGSGDYDIATSVDDDTGLWGNGVLATGAGVNTNDPEFGPILMPTDKTVVAAPGVQAGALVFDGLDQLDNRRGYATSDFGSLSRSLVSGINTDGDTRSVAIAHGLLGSFRFWYMSRRVISGGIYVNRMYTKRPPDAETMVPVTLYPGCAVDTTNKTQDLAPWVTPDGSYLFFHTHHDEGAACNQAPILRSFYAPLSASGQIEGEPVELEVMDPGVNVMTPSLSPDRCTLYFASDEDGSGGLQIYEAHRR